MLTPYDWQEGMGHRAQFVQNRLSTGVPVLAVSLEAGILAYTLRRQAQKLFEVYDRLMMGAIGQQSDVEALRVAAIEYAHREGFQRSEQDVTIQRLVAALSQPMKNAFANFNNAPFVAQALFMEIGAGREDDLFYQLDYDGDYHIRRGLAWVCGAPAQELIENALKNLDLTKAKPEQALESLRPIMEEALSAEGPGSFEDIAQTLSPEIVLLERNPKGESRFRYLDTQAES